MDDKNIRELIFDFAFMSYNKAWHCKRVREQMKLNKSNLPRQNFSTLFHSMTWYGDCCYLEFTTCAKCRDPVLASWVNYSGRRMEYIIKCSDDWIDWRERQFLKMLCDDCHAKLT